jgi:undecaprenyl diphosphate synthase
MDGNGRWAENRSLPRLAGHREGADAVRRTIEAAPGCGVNTVTLYAFSSDNWKRPPEEVEGLMELFRLHLASETPRCIREGVRVSVIGRRDRLPASVMRAIMRAEEDTSAGRRVHMRIAVDYSSRDMLLQAARRCSALEAWTREGFAAALGESDHGGAPAPDVDLLIRTGGEQRLSDFLLWECAYAELLFTPTMWPDFGEADLRAAVEWFRGRQRKFGGLPLQQDRAALYSQTV